MFIKYTVLLPNGKTSTRELIRHCKASCILAFLDNGKVLMGRQYRYPYDEVIYEFPAGKVDKGEDPIRCSKTRIRRRNGIFS